MNPADTQRDDRQEGDELDRPYVYGRHAALDRAILRRVLRTLARLETLTKCLNFNVLAEMLAKDSPHHADRLKTMFVYLELACERMCRIALARRCAECGCSVGFEIGPEGLGHKRTPRADARYCSPKCRQKAHRKRRRVTDSTPPAMTEPLRRNGSPNAGNGVSVTAPDDDWPDLPESLRRVP